MISNITSSLSKFIFCTKGFILIVISLTINNIPLSQGALKTKVFLDGYSNGPYTPEETVKYLFNPNLFSSGPTSPGQLSTIETSPFVQSTRQKANPSYDNLGESIAKKILHSFHLIDDNSVISSNQNNNVKRKKARQKDDQPPKEAPVVYRGGQDQGTSFILKDSVTNDNEKSIDGQLSEYILQDDNENGGLTDNEEILSILEQNAKNRRKQKKLYIDQDDDSDANDAPVQAKPGRYIIKKIFKGKNGELTAIDWVEDRGHAKQGAYHKEEWEDTQQKRNVVRKKFRKPPNKGEKKDETNDDDDDEDDDKISIKKSKKEKKKRKKKKKKKNGNKQKKQHEDDEEKEIEETTIDDEHIPQLLWSYLSRKNGKDSLPIEQIRISKV